MKRIVCGHHVVSYVDAMLGGAPDAHARGIGLERDGKLIAGVKFDNWNRRSICMHVAASGSGWMTREYLWYCFHYPFVEVGAHKILGLVAESNERARRFDEHLGFKLEYSIADAHPDGALLVYSMTKAQCRFLELKHGLKEQSPASA